MDHELGRLMGQMGLVLDELKDIKERLRALETVRWKVAGAAIAVGTLAGVIARLV